MNDTQEGLIPDYDMNHFLNDLIASDSDGHDEIIKKYIMVNHSLPKGYEQCVTEDIYLEVCGYIGLSCFKDIIQTPVMVFKFCSMYNCFIGEESVMEIIEHFVNIKDHPDVNKFLNRVKMFGLETALKTDTNASPYVYKRPI